MPIDPEPSADGNVELVTGCPADKRPTAIVHGHPDLFSTVRYRPHHATCPNWNTPT